MTFTNPFKYNENNDSRSSNECDGNCANCLKNDICPFSIIQADRYSRNNESGHELELRLGDSMRRTSRASRGSYSPGFDNPADYANSSPSSKLGYSNASSPGFHGSYDGSGGDYANANPKAVPGSFNYCGSCGKK